jgi:hypothetical protein
MTGNSPECHKLLNAVICSRIAELQEAISAEVITLEISSRNARVTSLQKRWDRLRDALVLVLDERGADMAEVPGGASGLLCRDYKWKGAAARIKAAVWAREVAACTAAA